MRNLIKQVKRNPLIVAGIVFIIYFIYRKLIQSTFKVQPVTGRISSGFGNRVHPISGKESFHNGVDIAVSTGTDIYSPANGKVLDHGYNDRAGYWMRVKHSNGYTT